jgi:hypothetical protein
MVIVTSKSHVFVLGQEVHMLTYAHCNDGLYYISKKKGCLVNNFFGHS